MSNGFDIDQPIITLELDDGSVLECIAVSIFPVEDMDYIALLPVEEANNDEGELLIYRYEETEEGEPILTNIEADEEYEAVADALEQILIEMEFDELDEDFDIEEGEFEE